MVTVKGAKGCRGFTLMEVLVVSLLISMVFLGALALYMTGIKFLKTAQTKDITALPIVAIGNMVERISLANDLQLNAGNKQLDVRLDNACPGGAALNTPSNFADDAWWHYRFVAGSLVGLCDGVQGTNLTGAEPQIVSVNSGLSNFSLVNVSADPLPIVVNIRLVAVNPSGTFETNATALSLAKRRP